MAKMNIWKKKSREKEEVPIDGQTFQFEKGDLNLRNIHYWQENPRLEGKAKDFEDNDEGTVNEKIMDLMLGPDKIRKLANQIDKDGGLRMPIWVGEDEDGKYVVYDGNRRYSAILHLQKATGKPKYNTIKAVLMEAPGLTFVQRLAISTAFNTDGVKEWSPYARAEMLTNLYDNKMQEGSDEKGALKFAQSAMTGAGGVAQIKAMIDSHRLINKYKLSNDRFSIVNEGYVKAIHRKQKARTIEVASQPDLLEKVFIKTLKKAVKSEGAAFNAQLFRNKIKTIWKGSIADDELSKKTWKDFSKDVVHLDDAVDNFEAAQLGGLERKKIDDFHEFVTKVRNQKKIIAAIANDRKFRNKIGKLDQIMDLLLMGVDNLNKAKGKRKKK
jgi:hypothetical protein